jgi:hypothetical protein
MKIAFAITLGFILGFFAHWALVPRPTTDHHWKLVRLFKAYVNDPSNYRPDAATGFSVTTPPDPGPSLAVLVAAGELRHVDLVLPSVLSISAAERHWMRFCETNEAIIWATGNPSYTAFHSTGAQPLHLNVWFKHNDESAVRILIQELEEKFGDR